MPKTPQQKRNPKDPKTPKKMTRHQKLDAIVREARDKADRDAKLIPRIVTQQEQESVQSLGGDTMTSSVDPSNRTVKLSALFPENKSRYKEFDLDCRCLAYMKYACNIDIFHIARLQNVGIVTPAFIVNRFGADTISIAETFAMMGPSYILDKAARLPAMYLMIFARTELLKGTEHEGEFDLPISTTTEWRKYKKNSTYSKAFQEKTDDDFEDMMDVMTDPSILRKAQEELKKVKALIRQWIKSSPTDSESEGDTKKKSTKQAKPQQEKSVPKKEVKTLDEIFTPKPNPINETASSKEMVEVKKMLAEFQKITKSLHQSFEGKIETVRKSMDNMKMEIEQGVDNKLKEKLNRKLKFTTPESSTPVASSSPDNSSDPDSSEDDNSISDSDSEFDQESIPDLTPFPKKKPARSFKPTHNRKGDYSIPKSPMDAGFQVGCNDKYLDLSTIGSEGTLTSSQKKRKKKVEDWMRSIRADSKAKTTSLCTTKTPLKRAPLPSSVSWNGKGGLLFEKFIQQFTGHVTQQSHMGYILTEKIAVLWLCHGDPTIVLQTGIQRKIHPSLIHISPSQFLIDIVWLYGAMQQSITGRGNAIIRDHEDTQDGILAWKRFLQTYRYDGDVDVYLSQQYQVLS